MVILMECTSNMRMAKSIVYFTKAHGIVILKVLM